MTGDTLKRGPSDQSRIDLTDPEEAAWWVKQLGAPIESIAAAIEKVGNVAVNVEDFLKK